MTSAVDVSRETEDRLNTLVQLLEKWNPKINLVAKATLADVWTRHIADSVQVFESTDRRSGTWLDMGSGGGFPGLVVAIVAAEQAPELAVHLVDSDQRKCSFLRTVIRETGISAKVTARRLEDIEPVQATVISARALAPLSDLLGYAKRHWAPGSVALFQKGRNWHQEVADAEREWRFQHEALPSKTDPEAVILRIKEIEHV